jgi:hypothetical protein
MDIKINTINMKRITLILFFFLFCIVVNAQENPKDTTTYLVTTTNGVQYIGTIISDDGREVLIETKTVGKLYIAKATIKSISKIKESSLNKIKENYEEEEVSLDSPFSTRYYFTTNCFPVKKRENYAMVHLYGPEVHFSVSNRFSVGIMSTWIASPIALALKYTFPTKNAKLNFGLGTILGNTGYINQGRGFGGLHWGMVTLGDRDNNLTISAGIAYVNASSTIYTPGVYNPNTFIPFANNKLKTMSVLGFAGTKRIGEKASLFFDSMVFLDRRQSVDQNIDQFGQLINTTVSNQIAVTAFLMPGIRIQRTENKSFQVALAGVIGQANGESFSFPIPMCAWLYKF